MVITSVRDQKDRQDDAAIPADIVWRAARPQQLAQRRREHEVVDGGIHRVEDPPQPGDHEDQDLVAVQARGLLDGHSGCRF
jgi:hypothetical protein